DGSERTVEDMLKKLPGIKVADNGQISFKNRLNKRFLIEGDDIFDQNYVSRSRNISIDIIDKVQALDHFSDNPLLKGVLDTDDVALNLTLKKGVSEFSGNIAVGLGLEDKYLLDATVLRISS